jgi:hypothetical protein
MNRVVCHQICSGKLKCTDCTDQRLRKAAGGLASQEIPLILWNPLCGVSLQVYVRIRIFNNYSNFKYLKDPNKSSFKIWRLKERLKLKDHNLRLL